MTVENEEINFPCPKIMTNLRRFQIFLHTLKLLKCIPIISFELSPFHTFFGYYFTLLTIFPLLGLSNFNASVWYFVFYEIFMFYVIIALYFVPFLLSALQYIAACANLPEIIDGIKEITPASDIVPAEMVFCQALIMIGVIALYEYYVGIYSISRLTTGLVREIFPIIRRETFRPLGREQTIKDIAEKLKRCKLYELSALIRKNLNAQNPQDKEASDHADTGISEEETINLSRESSSKESNEEVSDENESSVQSNVDEGTVKSSETKSETTEEKEWVPYAVRFQEWVTGRKMTEIPFPQPYRRSLDNKPVVYSTL